jgi:hypothetical protein
METDLARDPGKDIGIHVRRLAYACPIAGKQQPLFRLGPRKAAVIIADFAFMVVAHSTNLPQPQPAFVEALPLSITVRFAFFGFVLTP